MNGKQFSQFSLLWEMNGALLIIKRNEPETKMSRERFVWQFPDNVLLTIRTMRMSWNKE